MEIAEEKKSNVSGMHAEACIVNLLYPTAATTAGPQSWHHSLLDTHLCI